MPVGRYRNEIRNVHVGISVDFRFEHRFGVTRPRANMRKKQFILHIAVIRFVHIPTIPPSPYHAETIGQFNTPFDTVIVVHGVTEQAFRLTQDFTRCIALYFVGGQFINF